MRINAKRKQQRPRNARPYFHIISIFKNNYKNIYSMLSLISKPSSPDLDNYKRPAMRHHTLPLISPLFSHHEKMIFLILN